MKVWIVVEETEAGTLADGTTYCPLSAHADEAGAIVAVAAWEDTNGEMDEDGWNDEGLGVVIHCLDLEVNS